MLTRAEIGSNLSAKCKIYSQQTQRMDKRFNSNSMIINRRVIRSKTITKASNKTEQQESTATTATKKSATQKVQNKEDVDVLFNNMVKKLKKNKKTEIIPIFCRLSSQAVTISNFLQQPKALKVGFQALRVAGIRGVHVTVFWGIVEGAPRVYDWDAYEQLFEIVESVGELEVSVEFAFHAKACGGNDGDACTASLPVWVHDQAEANPELFYKDQSGLRENVVISLFAEEDKNLLPTNVKGERRSAIQCYEDFMESFANKFQKYFENGTITTATVGSGPNGELRYPAFPEEVWEFPGIGSFQVNDKYALRKLKSVAMEKNCKDWGHSGPHDAGLVNDFGPVSNFFQDNGSWKTDYGQFFLSFYSEELVKHGDRMIKSAHNAIRSKYPDVELEMRIPNTYWWNHCESRPAQTTSGYPRFTDPSRDAFDDVMNMISRNNAHATVQGGELGDESIADSNATNAQANPEKSLSYVKQSASRNGVEYALETKAVEDFSDESFRMLYAHGMGVDDVCEANCNLQIFAEDCTTGDCSISKRAIVGEIGSKMFEPENWKRLVLFHQSMAGYNAWEVPAQKKKNNNRNNPATTVTTTSTTTMVENNDELNTKFAEMNHTNNSMNNLNTSSVVANQQHQNSSSCTSSR
jgi:beta-amylase